jgi:hypothetical protein
MPLVAYFPVSEIAEPRVIASQAADADPGNNRVAPTKAPIKDRLIFIRLSSLIFTSRYCQQGTIDELSACQVMLISRLFTGSLSHNNFPSTIPLATSKYTLPSLIETY